VTPLFIVPGFLNHDSQSTTNDQTKQPQFFVRPLL
jgi:hypothetical protein